MTHARQISGKAGVWVVWLHFLLRSKESFITRMDVLLLNAASAAGKGEEGLVWIGRG